MTNPTNTKIPALRVAGYEVRSYTLNPTRGSYVVSQFQQRLLPGVKKIRHARVGLEWKLQIAATPAGFEAVRAASLRAEAVAAGVQ